MTQSPNDTGDPYNYPSLVQTADEAVRAVEGRVLRHILVHVVADEFNIVWLQFDDASYAIHGRIGGEVLNVVLETRPVAAFIDLASESSAVRQHPPFAIFEGRRLVQARTIGSAWNGHGFELSFAGLPDRTLIVQSIYAGEPQPDLTDCLRLGVGVYESRAEQASSRPSP